MSPVAAAVHSSAASSFSSAPAAAKSNGAVSAAASAAAPVPAVNEQPPSQAIAHSDAPKEKERDVLDMLKNMPEAKYGDHLCPFLFSGTTSQILLSIRIVPLSHTVLLKSNI